MDRVRSQVQGSFIQLSEYLLHPIGNAVPDLLRKLYGLNFHSSVPAWFTVLSELYIFEDEHASLEYRVSPDHHLLMR
jgi:hypothetical protein